MQNGERVIGYSVTWEIDNRSGVIALTLESGRTINLPRSSPAATVATIMILRDGNAYLLADRTLIASYAAANGR